MGKLYTVQVQAQFEVMAETEEDACDAAVAMAMDIEPSEWGTVVFPRTNREQMDLAFKLVGKDLRFNHIDGGTPLRIQTVNSAGMVTIAGMSGEFAPHLFKVVV